MANNFLSWCKLHSCKPNLVLCVTKCRSKLPKISKKVGKIYFASFCATFSSAFAITMMFPFLPFMVEFLLPWLLEDETQVATYVGIVASAMFVGRMISGYIWGAIADCKGRKPVILVSLVLMGISSAIFGFSVHYAMAVVLRFLVGFTNGAIGTVKAIISEVSDDSTQAFGLSLVGASFGLGIIVGPAVSGAISDPIGQYNLTIENYAVREFLTRFPYSLPCLINLLFCLLAAVIFYFLVPETLGMKKNRRRSEISQQDIDLAIKNTNASELESNDIEFDDSESAALILNDTLSDSTDSVDSRNVSSNTTSSTENSAHNTTEASGSDLNSTKALEGGSSSITMNCEHSPQNNGSDSIYTLDHNSQVMTVSSDGVQSSEEEPQVVINETSKHSDCSSDNGVVKVRDGRGRRLSWGQIPSKKVVKSSLKSHCLYMKDKSVFLSITIYTIFSFGLIGWNEVLPVWAKTSPHLGGLGFSLGEIGLALTISGILFLPFSFFLYPLLEKRFGSVYTAYAAFLVVIPTIMLIPNVHYLSEWRGLLWVLLCLLLFLNQTCIGVVVTCTILFVNNSVTFDKLGAVNGLALVVTSLGRSFSPLVVGGLFSLSLSATQSGLGYPLDYRLVFLVLGFTFLLCVLLMACLPRSINKQKIIEDVE